MTAIINRHYHLFHEEASGTHIGFTINLTTAATSPTTCIVFDSDSDITTVADGYLWAYGMCTPSVVANGTLNYKLNKQNLAQKEDGTASNLTGTDGDVCMSLAPMWWKASTVNGNPHYDVWDYNPGISDTMTAHKFNGTIRRYLHYGMFNMSGSGGNSVYSTSATPYSNITHDTARGVAEARGATYGGMTHLSWEAYKLLCMIASGSTNCQTTIGQDYTESDDCEPCTVSTSAMLTANGYTSSTASSASTSLMYLFLANPWGNVYDWLYGLKLVNGTLAVATDQADARGVAVNDSIPSTWTTITKGFTSGGYVTNVLATNAAPLFPSAIGGSSSTYFCDYGYIQSNTSNKYCARVGGYYGDDANAGLFCVIVNYSSSGAYDYLGARLQILDTQTV